MKHYTLSLLFIVFSLHAIGQEDSWFSFYSENEKLFGFKDKTGITKIEARFMALTLIEKFDFIAAVTEEQNRISKNYYLTKSGRVVGLDSVYTFDAISDCENEGFIRFKDQVTDKVGLFNRHGDIVVPAAYNGLTKVKNGMLEALKGAEKRFLPGGEHYEWIGGEQLLLDTNNNVLIEKFNSDYDLNFYSIRISNSAPTDPIRRNFKAVDGKYYSFVDFDKEFKTWVKTYLLDNFTKGNLLEVAFEEITIWNEQEGWMKKSKQTFIEKNYKLIKSKLHEVNSSKNEYFIFSDGLNEFMFTSPLFKNYYDNCHRSKDWIYPVKSIVIEHKNKNNLTQDVFDFLRTEDGYKLICISLKSGQLK